MKKLLLALIVVLCGASARAQETYAFGPTTPAQTARINIARRIHNERTCTQAGLPFNCTEPQLQAVSGFESARIYPDSQQGRQELIRDTLLVPWFQDILNDQRGWDAEAGMIFWCAAAQPAKDAACTAQGRSAGCALYSCP